MTAPTKTNLKSELMTLENQYRDAMKAGDGKAMERLTADGSVLVGGQGVRTVRRNEIAGMAATSEFQLQKYKVDDGTVTYRELAPGVAALAYRVEEDYLRGGKPYASNSYNCSTWVKNGNSWECAVHTETMIEPPR